MAVSPELARIYASAPVDEVVYETLEISHPRFLQTNYLTNSAIGFKAKLETGVQVEFLTFPFQIKLPSSGTNGFQDITIILSNIDRRIVDGLERANAEVSVPISFTYRAYASIDLEEPGFVLPKMSASEVTVDIESVSAKASLSDLVNRDFPNQLYTPRLFPMLLNQG